MEGYFDKDELLKRFEQVDNSIAESQRRQQQDSSSLEILPLILPNTPWSLWNLANKYSGLKQSRERELLDLASSGDIRARDLLVLHNLRSLCALADQRKPFSFVDLVQAGYIGILRALETYSKESQARFATYAHGFVLSEMTSYIRLESRIVLSENAFRNVRRVQRAVQHLQTQDGADLFDLVEELAETTGLDLVQIYEVLGYINLVNVENYKPRVDDDMQAQQEEPQLEGAEERAERNEIVRCVNLMLRAVDPDFATALQLKYGLLGGKEHSLPEISSIQNVSRTTVSKRIRKAKEILKAKYGTQIYQLLGLTESQWDAEPDKRQRAGQSPNVALSTGKQQIFIAALSQLALCGAHCSTDALATFINRFLEVDLLFRFTVESDDPGVLEDISTLVILRLITLGHVAAKNAGNDLALSESGLAWLKRHRTLH